MFAQDYKNLTVRLEICMECERVKMGNLGYNCTGCTVIPSVAKNTKSLRQVIML